MLHVSPPTKGAFKDWPQDLTCAAQFCGTPLKETYLVKFLKFLLLLLRACFDLFLHQLFSPNFRKIQILRNSFFNKIFRDLKRNLVSFDTIVMNLFLIMIRERSSII